MSTAADEEPSNGPPPCVDPYQILGLDRHATADQVKSAYRKQALKHHPDKASSEDKSIAHVKFQEITFSYAVLSDTRRRSRYDTTGNTSESLDNEGDDFDWRAFFNSQKAELIDGEKIQMIKDEYQHSVEETTDVLAAFEDNEGDMDAVYEEIMCSSVLEDDERFRNIIDEAIGSGEVKPWKTYKRESGAKKRTRVAKAKKEELEATEYAEELGVADQLFGSGKEKNRKEKDTSDLAALIQQRQKGRQAVFLDNLEARYAGASKASQKGIKRNSLDEPSEQAFEMNRRKKARP